MGQNVMGSPEFLYVTLPSGQLTARVETPSGKILDKVIYRIRRRAIIAFITRLANKVKNR